MLIIQPMILINVVTALCINLAVSIKFNYVASKHEYICFHEQVQKQTRYQLIVKSNKPTYSLQMFEEDVSIYQDQRPEAYIKYYSAFSKIEGIVLFCLANKDYQEQIAYQIEFYHGSHLEGLMGEISSDSFSQLQDIYGQCVEMQGFVNNAYDMNVKTLLQRNQIMGGLGVGLAIATLGFFVVLALSRATLLLKLKKMMKARKLI